MKEIFNRTSNPLFHVLCQIINEIYAGKTITKKDIQRRIKDIPAFQYNEAPEDDRELSIIDTIFHFDTPDAPATICLNSPVPSLVTDTELAWLKNMLLDDDFDFLLPEALRNDLIQRLKDVTPLYDTSLWCGKPHCDSTIKPILRTIINAFVSKKLLTINDNEQLVPYRLEYDLAYGAYTLIAWQPKSKAIIKISLNINTQLASSSDSVPAEVSTDISTYLNTNLKEIKLEITPTRNSVERCLFLFSTYDKET